MNPKSQLSSKTSFVPMARWVSATCILLVLLGGCDREEVELAEQAAQARLEGVHDARMELEGTQGMVDALEGGGSLPAEDDGPPRPEDEPSDFLPGAVYGLHPQMCHNHGGSTRTDPEGQPYCNLGEVSAVFRCAGGSMVALIDRPRGRKILHRETGSYEAVEPEARDHATRYVGEHNVFNDFGDEGHLNTAEWGVNCRRVHS